MHLRKAHSIFLKANPKVAASFSAFVKLEVVKLEVLETGVE